MTVLQSQAYLRKPVENLILCEIVLGHLRLTLVLRLQVLNLQRHVATCMHKQISTNDKN